MDPTEVIRMESLGDQDGGVDTNWSPLGAQIGSIWVITMEPLGDLHGRLDANWGRSSDSRGIRPQSQIMNLVFRSLRLALKPWACNAWASKLESLGDRNGHLGGPE